MAKKLVLDVNESQSSEKDKGQTSGKGQSSGKEQEPYVVTLEPGQSSAECNVGSSQFPSQFVNEFYSSYDPYEEFQDPNFDPFADLEIILPTVNNKEGNTSQNVEVENETDVQHEIEEVESKNKPGDDTDEDNDDSPNSDYLVDEDNNVDEVDVENSRGNFTIQEVALVLEFQSLTRGNFQAKGWI
ncbi:hypothetical protein Tco_0154022 [Tanacetum coccineum]